MPVGGPASEVGGAVLAKGGWAQSILADRERSGQGIGASFARWHVATRPRKWPPGRARNCRIARGERASVAPFDRQRVTILTFPSVSASSDCRHAGVKASRHRAERGQLCTITSNHVAVRFSTGALRATGRRRAAKRGGTRGRRDADPG